MIVLENISDQCVSFRERIELTMFILVLFQLSFGEGSSTDKRKDKEPHVGFIISAVVLIDSADTDNEFLSSLDSPVIGFLCLCICSGLKTLINTHVSIHITNLSCDLNQTYKYLET